MANPNTKRAVSVTSSLDPSSGSSLPGSAMPLPVARRQRPVARVMTYNVHSFVGTDRVYDPERVARVIESAGASIVALQEVDFGRGPRAEPSAIESLAERLRMRCHFTFTRDGGRGHFGNAVLTPHSLQLIA